MLSQIKTLLTDHASTCVTHANKLAYTNNKRTIQGEDIVWGSSLYLKHHELNTIFWKLLGVSEESIDEYFQSKYTTKNIIPTKKEIQQLPLSKKLTQIIHSNITQKTKKIDLDLLFLVSLQDLSNQSTTHTQAPKMNTKKLVLEYKKLTKNPMIIKM